LGIRSYRSAAWRWARALANHSRLSSRNFK
jgi:hypothetical protein